MSEVNKKNSLTNSFNIPYPIGTYVYKIEDGLIKVDQVYEYILGENGISVRLILGVLTDYPSVSVKIDLERFLNNWNECKNARNERSAKAEAEKLAKEKKQPLQLVKKPKRNNKVQQ